MLAPRVRVTIIGSGPAGYTAAITAARANLGGYFFPTEGVSQNIASRPSAPNTARRSEMYTASR